MFWFQLAVLFVVAWCICATFNIAVMHFQDGHLTKGEKQFCFGGGPMMTILILGYGLIYLPMRGSAILGCKIGDFFIRKFN